MTISAAPGLQREIAAVLLIKAAALAVIWVLWFSQPASVTPVFGEPAGAAATAGAVHHQ